MSAPSQEFPSWLTQSFITLTDAAGVPIETQTTVLYLPLTYYGPPIPLNSDWTYGGLSSPASTADTATATPSPSLTSTPTATPTDTPTTSSSALSSASSSSSSSSSALSSPTSALPSSTSSETASASPSPAPTAFGATSHNNTNLAIILSSIFGALLLAFLLLLLWILWRRGRRARSEPATSSAEQRYANLGGDSTSDAFAASLPMAGDRPSGEGSPRGSGEETDSFLRRSRRAPQMSELGVAPVASGGVVATQSSGSTSQTMSTDTNASGFGQVIPSTLSTPPFTEEERGLGPVTLAAIPPALGLYNRSGHILSPRDLNRIGEEESLHSDSHTFVQDHDTLYHDRLSPPPEEEPSNAYSPLVPPQRLDPDFGYTPRPEVRKSNSSSQRSSYPLDADEAATFLTATRVQVGELGPRSSTTVSAPSAWFSGLNWLRPNSNTNSHSGSKRSSYIDHGASEDDLESANVLLRPSAGPQPDRPISSISTGSGGTIYHDASSTLQSSRQSSVPLRSPSPLAPLPVASRSNSSGNTPPAPSSQSQTAAPQSNPFDALLDEPAPLPFTALAGRPISKIGPLDTVPHHSYSDTMNGSSGGSAQLLPGSRPVNNPFLNSIHAETGSRRASVVNPQITIDLLEEAPPSAGAGWRSIAASSSNPRYTFGLPAYINRDEDHDSLTSIRSGHLSPSGSRSGSGSGSSRGHALFGSNGSSARIGSEGDHSQGHSSGGSHSSDGHRKSRAPISPTLSAFGPSASLIRPPPPVPHLSTRHQTHQTQPQLLTAGPSGSSLAATTTTYDTTHTTTDAATLAEPTSPKSFNSVPWAAGLDGSWIPT